MRKDPYQGKCCRDSMMAQENIILEEKKERLEIRQVIYASYLSPFEENGPKLKNYVIINYVRVSY